MHAAGSSTSEVATLCVVALLLYTMWQYRPKEPLHHRLDYMAKLAGFASYAAYLETKYWKRQKLRTAERYGNVCFICGSKKDFRCHHASYDNFPYHEKDSDLINLCATCHSEVHVINRQEHVPLRRCHLVYKARYKPSRKPPKKKARI